MPRVDLKFFLALLILWGGCQKLTPKIVRIPDYPDINQLYKDQVKQLDSKGLTKEVILDTKREKRTFQMDTSAWKKELSFLSEINPNQAEYVGVFEVQENDHQIELNLKSGEIGVLKHLTVIKLEDQFQSIRAIVHEDKDVYTHHREVKLTFDDNLLNSFEIKGYQKMLFKDTVRFAIRGEVSGKKVK